MPEDALHISDEMHSVAITWPGEVKWDGEKFVRIVPDPRVADESLLRAKRDALLRASDWTQLPDAPLHSSFKEKWADYRKQLRDLPSTKEWPSYITWPNVPVPDNA